MKLFAINVGNSKVATIVAADDMDEAIIIARLKAMSMGSTFSVEEMNDRAEISYHIEL